MTKFLTMHDLGEDWFEILLPSLQLVLTDKVPEQQRQKAKFTLERLRLRFRMNEFCASVNHGINYIWMEI